MNSVPQKTCNKCRQLKALQEFSRDVRASDGHMPRCKICERTRLRVYHERIKGESRGKGPSRNYDGDPERAKAHNRAQARQWYAAHKEHASSRKKRLYRKDPTKRRQQARRWAILNADRRRAYDNRRRAHKQQSDGSYTGLEWQQLKQQYDNHCLCCGKREPEIKLTADHVIPLSWGGSNDISNIQPLCFSCNASKGNFHATDYRLTWQYQDVHQSSFDF